MKRLNVLILCFLPLFIQAQIVTTFAGGGTGGAVEGGPATTATLSNPAGGVFDKHGNYFFGESLAGNRVRKIDTAGIITTVAGTGVQGFSGDGGPATNAKLYNPASIMLDSVGNLYICDGGNFRLRKVTAATGIISTIAGNGVGLYTGDGVPATAAGMTVFDVCFDKTGLLCIADFGNARVRRVSATGIISTIAGNGQFGYSGDGTRADTAKIDGIAAICTDKTGNLYLGANSQSRILKINSAGILSTFAGTGSFLFNGDEIPATAANVDPVRITFDKYGNFYIAERHNYRVRRVDQYGIIHTVAGIGTPGFSGDGGPATAAQFLYPTGVAFDSCGNVYIPEANNNRVRKVTFAKCNYLDVPEAEREKELSIYPNPTNVFLNIDGIKGYSTFRLINVVGSSMQHGILRQGNNCVSIQSLPPGIYMLELTNAEGEKIIRKIVKQ